MSSQLTRERPEASFGWTAIKPPGDKHKQKVSYVGNKKLPQAEAGRRKNHRKQGEDETCLQTHDYGCKADMFTWLYV